MIVTGNFRDVAGSPSEGHVVLSAIMARPSMSGDYVVTRELHRIPLVGGGFVSPEVDAGPLLVELSVSGVWEHWRIMVPEGSGTADLADLVEGATEWSPVVVSRAVEAADQAKVSATAAKASESAAASSASAAKASENKAAGSESAAAGSATAAKASEDAAGASASAAKASEDKASAAALSASTYSVSVTKKYADVIKLADQAAGSESAAAGSATAAKASEDAAGASASAAKASEDKAAASAARAEATRVTSITDEDGDGVATVAYADGHSDMLPLPRGPRGEKGDDGPVAEVTVDMLRGAVGEITPQMVTDAAGGIFASKAHTHVSADIADAVEGTSASTANAGKLVKLASPNGYLQASKNPGYSDSAVAKQYVDDKIAAIPAPDLSGKADKAHTHTTAHITDAVSTMDGVPGGEHLLKTNRYGSVTLAKGRLVLSDSGFGARAFESNAVVHKKYVDTKVDAKADKAHKHAAADIKDAFQELSKKPYYKNVAGDKGLTLGIYRVGQVCHMRATGKPGTTATLPEGFRSLFDFTVSNGAQTLNVKSSGAGSGVSLTGTESVNSVSFTYVYLTVDDFPAS